ncbi:MAG: sensor histidine kinase [Chloroflexota bacterium]
MSLRLRLTLWYTGILAATLLVVSLTVYGLLIFELNQQVDQILSARADQFSRALVLAGVNPRGDRLGQMLATFNPDTYAQFVAADGRPVSQTSNLPANWPIDRVIIHQVLTSGKRADQTFQSGGLTYRIENFPVAANNQMIGVVQLGRDITQMDASLRLLREILIFADLAGVAGAFAAGWVLAKRALKPIDRITRTARDIGQSQDFSRRVEHSNENDELGRLTQTFNEMLGQIQAAYRQIESALNAQRRFVADASHELRTPLTTIRGNIGLLSNGWQVNADDRREAIQDMAGEAERMSRLVGNLLVLARADAGLRFEKRPARVDEIIHEVIRQARVLNESVYLCTGCISVANVHGNPDYLKQLLLILVDNALKNTAAGGTVEVSNPVEGGWTKLTVRDTGKGIPADALPHIFERFYQADKSRSGGGTGLGLAIAKWIAQEHRGRIEAESTPGRGSSFTVWLPLDHQRLPEPAAPKAEKVPAGAVAPIPSL